MDRYRTERVGIEPGESVGTQTQGRGREGSSWFSVHGSRFTIRSSRFMIRSSRFTIHGSRFAVHGSRFTIRRERGEGGWDEGREVKRAREREREKEREREGGMAGKIER